MGTASNIPSWLRRPLKERVSAGPTRGALAGLTTVCDEARCPNRGTCMGEERTATFLLLGPGCSRDCAFCSVASATSPPRPEEPGLVAAAVKQLALDYVVLTMTTRDDLADYGAGHLARAVGLLTRETPPVTVEVLTSDLGGDAAAVGTVLDAGVAVFGHNVETVPALYAAVRPGASYARSLGVLERASAGGIVTKSALMVGLGETAEEIHAVFRHLLAAGVSVVAVGQYFRPGARQTPVKTYWEPAAFDELQETALAMGFKAAACGPFVRSSYRAAALFKRASLN